MNYTHLDYLWLKHELATIKTSSFHCILQKSSSPSECVVERVAVNFPKDYECFVSEFGESRFFRMGSNRGYRMGVFSRPRPVRLRLAGDCYQIGFIEGSQVFMRLCGSDLWEIIDGHREVATFEAFSEWLRKSYDAVRSSYTPRQWKSILMGPPPFSAKEVDLLQLRRKISWRIVEILPNNQIVIRIFNGSRDTLAWYTLGVRSKDGNLHGALWLDTSRILPGETANVVTHCYPGLVADSDIEIYDLPEPRPEDREFFREFWGPKGRR